MPASSFDYYRATSIDDAIALLQAHPEAKFLAGGHSLLPAMNLRLAHPDALIDLGRVAELRGIQRENGKLRIGAMTTYVTVASSDESHLPEALRDAVGGIGDPQVRNRGTVGGNVSHADPGSDLPTVMLALNAIFNMIGPNGARQVAASNFFVGLFETALQADELLVSVDVPSEGSGKGSAYAKFENPASRYAMVGAAATLTVDLTGKCTAASVAVGGLTSRATAAPSVSAALVGDRLSSDSIHAAAAAVLHDLGADISGDMHASAEYRRQMAPVMVERALLRASRRAGWLARFSMAVQDASDDMLEQFDRSLGSRRRK